MRLATIRTRVGSRAARVDGTRVVELPFADLGELLTHPAWATAAQADGPARSVSDVDFAPLVPRPGKIICLGLNYRSHISEMAHEMPAHPTLFAKFADALIGAHDDIHLPPESTAVDWEAELGIVIGADARRAGRDEAAAAIAGFTVVNDVTMRDWQRRTLQWLQGKTFEHTTPLGPVLVTGDELGGVEPDLQLRCEVDGRLMQESRTSDLVFTPPDIVAYVSTIVTLRPGDVISTGTPAGVGDARRPPVYLREGQIVRTSIEGIGELVNRCVISPARSTTSSALEVAR